jgi:hypothetical protein
MLLPILIWLLLEPKVVEADMKNEVKLLTDNLVKVNDNFTVNMFLNGFSIELNGHTDKDEWKSVKIIATDLDTLDEIIKKISSMPRD